MQFHLTYEGLLLGSSRDNTRPDHKHEIRRVFHRQLRRLWEGHPWLNQVKHGVYVGFEHISPDTPLREGLAQQFTRGNYRYVPLVR